MYDVIIIGAGPAGATLARLLAGKRKVLLVDSRPMSVQIPDYDDSYREYYPQKQDTALPSVPYKDKCCGGLLAPDAQRWLVKQGLNPPASVLDTVQPNLVRAIDLSKNFERVYPCPYINLNRAAFEQWLISLIAPDVEKKFDCRCTKITYEQDHFTITLNKYGEIENHTCKLLVGADGANSKVRKFLNKKLSTSCQYLALQDSFNISAKDNQLNPNLMHEYVALFNPELTDFYGWIIPKHNVILLGIALPPESRALHDSNKRMAELKKTLLQVGYDFEIEFKRKGCMLLRPRIIDLAWGDNGAFLIGEAGGWISPSSAEGYSYAFISAAALSKAILKQKTPERILKAYQIYTIPLSANIFYKQIKSSIIFNSTLRQTIMHTGILAKI